jgi:large subunit ribosomal protein L9
MKLILREKIANLGGVGAQVVVKAGYARNYLIPSGKAEPATAKNIAEFEKVRAQYEAKAKDVLEQANQRAEQVKQLAITVSSQASDEGKLYGSVGPREVAHAITEMGVPVLKSEVIMPEGAIRAIGEYDVTIRLHSEVDTSVKIKITPA